MPLTDQLSKDDPTDQLGLKLLAARGSQDSGGRRPARRLRRRRFQFRFVTIWVLLAGLFLASAVVVPASLQPTSVAAILPFIAFAAIAGMGEALVMMVGGMDLSIPAVIGLVAVCLVSLSAWSVPLTIGVVLAMALAVGLANGIMVCVLRLNTLLVTLSVNTVLTGGMQWYLSTLRLQSRVAPSLSDWAASQALGINYPVWVAIGLTLALTWALTFTPVGRRFSAVGANPSAAWVAGLSVQRYQIGAYVAGAGLYGIAGVLLSAFIRTPSSDVGAPYLLGPVAAVVLGTGTIAPGVGSMIATFVGAAFLTQLDQVLKVMGLPSSAQYIVQGAAIAGGMAMASVPSLGKGEQLRDFVRWKGRRSRPSLSRRQVDEPDLLAAQSPATDQPGGGARNVGGNQP